MDACWGTPASEVAQPFLREAQRRSLHLPEPTAGLGRDGFKIQVSEDPLASCPLSPQAVLPTPQMLSGHCGRHKGNTAEGESRGDPGVASEGGMDTPQSSDHKTVCLGHLAIPTSVPRQNQAESALILS